MALYKAYDSNVEVNGQTISSFVNGTQPSFRQFILSILAANGIKDVLADSWYPQQNWLNAFKEIAEKVGTMTLHAIGKAIPESAVFPPQINDLKSALSVIDVAYHMNHRNGEIGYYKLISFDAAKRHAVVECINPYPDTFDQGIIASMAKRFKPNDSYFEYVEQDKSKPSRSSGAEASTFVVNW